MWHVIGTSEILVKKKTLLPVTSNQMDVKAQPVNKSPEEQAIELVAAFSDTVIGRISNSPMSYAIPHALSGLKGSIQIVGWRAQRIDDQTYLVAFEYKTPEGLIGYYFDFNLNMKIVRNVADDPDLQKKYELECVYKYEDSQCSTCKSAAPIS